MLTMIWELGSLQKISTWTMFAKLDKTKIIARKWIFKRKEGKYELNPRYKVR